MILIIFVAYARLSIPQVFVEDSCLSRRNNVTKLEPPDVFVEYSAFISRIRRFREGFKSFFYLLLRPRSFLVTNFLETSGNTDYRLCGNKMPIRCNRGFYCRSYCLLNMFRAPLCPSSGAQEYYTVVAACGISCCGFKVAGLVWS